METTGSEIPNHHVKHEVCTTRPSYREGRKLTSVKVYTVHQESKYLLVQNVPAVGAREQLTKLMGEFGAIQDLHPLDEYPADKFTEVYLVKFHKIQSARFAKKKLDDHAFFGGGLHICYAPEYETVKETREKLQDRRKVIAAKVRKLEAESESSSGIQTAHTPSTASNGSQLSLTSQQPLALAPPPPPPSSFQPPPPPPPPSHRPPPQMLLEAPGFSTTSPSSAPPTAFGQASGSHRTFERPGNAPPSQRVGTMPPCCTTDYMNQQSHADMACHPAVSGVTFQIPPPPMPGVSFDASQYRTPHFTRKDYGFAWVPSANSSFPPGYDPRLPQQGSEGSGDGELGTPVHSVEERESSHVSSSSLDRTEGDNRLQLVKYVPDVSSHQPFSSQVPLKPSDQTPKSLTNAPGAGSGKIVVKQYKSKGPPPRFVPRQLKERTDTTSEGKASVSLKRTAAKAEEEEKNRKIRREAFRLGEDQGPSLPTDPEERKQLLGQRPVVDPRVEASVVSSVKEIRKRMSKFISETVSKKLKTSAETQSAKTSDRDGSSAE